ncbi:unnamed protein product [Caenorhabditis nigoni]
MKELVWSDALAQDLSVTGLEYIRDNEERFSAWVGTYEGHFNQLLNDTSKIRRNPDPVGTSHYMFPFVERIGCSKLPDSDNNNKWCFFSPGIPKEYFEDFELKIESLFLDSGEAGSKCENGYENDDGLCIVIRPTTSTVIPTTKKPTTETTTTTQKTTENSENDVATEPSSSYSIFSMVHIVVVLVFGFSVFT